MPLNLRLTGWISSKVQNDRTGQYRPAEYEQPVYPGTLSHEAR